MRYHFHIREDAGLIVDEEGGEFSDLETARAEARASVQDLVADDLRSGRPAPERRIEIADARGTVLDCVAVAVIPVRFGNETARRFRHTATRWPARALPWKSRRQAGPG